MFKILFSLNDLFCMKFDMDYSNDEVKTKTGDICILDSDTTHIIFKHTRYFSDLKPTKVIINTISGPVDLIEGTDKANFILPNETVFHKRCFVFTKVSKKFVEF